MRDSLVASSIWRADFKKALETFPEFEIYKLGYADPGCDACHLSSRMSTRIGRLSGLPYDPTTFEVSTTSVRTVFNPSHCLREQAHGRA